MKWESLEIVSLPLLETLKPGEKLTNTICKNCPKIKYFKTTIDDKDEATYYDLEKILIFRRFIYSKRLYYIDLLSKILNKSSPMEINTYLMDISDYPNLDQLIDLIKMYGPEVIKHYKIVKEHEKDLNNDFTWNIGTNPVTNVNI
ncbi:hypothetical protein RhiirC2_794483 [Rhizophagus irregularis]|uniref:Uncharacterized protein n=1 Tax=Rhizophagus irregularis TaxID=588596 RepID=A0A2N1MDF9_9GLOM|nr:hypothetical protein RhiirC2_794483 [Rhizophagus irregularis]